MSIIKLISKGSFFIWTFSLADKATADEAYVTQVMLSIGELQDKGKGPYTEISTLLSEFRKV